MWVVTHTRNLKIVKPIKAQNYLNPTLSHLAITIFEINKHYPTEKA